MKYLVAGLGNPGAEYAFTRHNIGFMVLDTIAEKEQLTFASNRHGVTAEWKFRGKKIILLKPNTYMNLSGKAIKYYIDTEKIPLENIMVITDDLALPFGTLRLRKKGSDGGHNGLKNIQELLQTTEYPRLRFGIGNNFSKGQQVDFVLSEWGTEEKAALAERMQAAINAVSDWVVMGIDRAMNVHNK